MKWPFSKQVDQTEQEREEARTNDLRALLEKKRLELLEQTLREASRHDG